MYRSSPILSSTNDEVTTAVHYDPLQETEATH